MDIKQVSMCGMFDRCCYVITVIWTRSRTNVSVDWDNFTDMRL